MLDRGKLMQELKGHLKDVLNVAISSNNKYIVSTSHEFVCKVWDRETGSLVRELIGHKNALLCVAISSDSKLIATGSADLTLRFWNLENGE
jgi:WD40 repeat protein